MTDEMLLAVYWESIPAGAENAADYDEMCVAWNTNRRGVRRILHDLSLYDNGDDFVLIRSSKTRGFYKTDDHSQIADFRRECLNKGRSLFAPVKKCNRILNAGGGQMEIFNNLRAVREAKGMKQREVCKRMRAHDRAFDVSLLSKMENGVCLPTVGQAAKLAQIYGVEPSELVRVDFPAFDISAAI